MVNVQRLVWWRNADGQRNKLPGRRCDARTLCLGEIRIEYAYGLTALLFFIVCSFFLFSFVHSALCSATT